MSCRSRFVPSLAFSSSLGIPGMCWLSPDSLLPDFLCPVMLHSQQISARSKPFVWTRVGDTEISSSLQVFPATSPWSESLWQTFPRMSPLTASYLILTYELSTRLSPILLKSSLNLRCSCVQRATPSPMSSQPFSPAELRCVHGSFLVRKTLPTHLSRRFENRIDVLAYWKCILHIH